MRYCFLLFVCFIHFSVSFPIIFGTVTTNKIYEYDALNGTLLNTITVPVYNGSSPVILDAMTIDQSGTLWVTDKGNSAVAQSFVGYNIPSQTILPGGVFPSQFQTANTVIQGVYISAGTMFMLTRICPGSTCNMYFYSVTNYDSNGGAIGLTLLHNSTNTYNNPGWRGLAWNSVQGIPYTNYNSQITGISFGSGIMNLGGTLTNQPVPFPSAFDSYVFDQAAFPNTLLYYFNQSPNNLYAFNFNLNTNTPVAVTYPDANGIFFTAYYNGSTTPVTSGQITTSPLTSGQITTGLPFTTSPLTSGQITTGSITTGSVTTGSVTTGSITTDSVTTSPQTSGDITTAIPFTTSPITSGQITTSPITSGDITTSRLTSGLITTSPLTSGDITTSPITSGILPGTGIPTGTYVGLFVGIGLAVAIIIGVLVGIFSGRLHQSRGQSIELLEEDEAYAQSKYGTMRRRV